jgi:hypothetical protein
MICGGSLTDIVWLSEDRVVAHWLWLNEENVLVMAH